MTSAEAADGVVVVRAVEAFRRGECVLVMDARDRENECDIFLHAEFCDEAKMAFLIRYTTGIVCAVADRTRLERFGLYPAVQAERGGNTDKNATNFYVSTDYLPETSTGVSASDRAATIRAMVNLLHKPEQFSKPGHVFPLCARAGGLLEREGHTEAAYDLCRLAEMPTVAAIGELMNPETGRMLSFEESQTFAQLHGLVLVTVDQLKAAVKQRFLVSSPALSPVTDGAGAAAGCRLPSHLLPQTGNSQTGDSQPGNSQPGRLQLFRCSGGVEVAALVKGDVRGKEGVAVRVHSECFTGDVLGSQRCDCGEQLQGFLTEVLDKPETECGALLYVRGQEGRGMGLANKLRAYAVQDELKLDTVDANLHVGFHTDTRDYSEIAAVIKQQLQIKSVTLYSNNPEKLASLGSDLVARVEPLAFKPNEHNKKYLLTKKERLRHKTVMDTMQWTLDATAPWTSQQVTQRVTVVAARWNADFVEPLLNECVQQLQSKHADVRVVRVPGALDLLAAARLVLKKATAKDNDRSSAGEQQQQQASMTDAVILIGVLIKGASDGYAAACQSLATGIAQLNATPEFATPVISGLLMCQDEGQAEERCADHKLGAGFALEALEMVALARSI